MNEKEMEKLERKVAEFLSEGEPNLTVDIGNLSVDDYLGLTLRLDGKYDVMRSVDINPQNMLSSMVYALHIRRKQDA